MDEDRFYEKLYEAFDLLVKQEMQELETSLEKQTPHTDTQYGPESIDRTEAKT